MIVVLRNETHAWTFKHSLTYIPPSYSSKNFCKTRNKQIFEVIFNLCWDLQTPIVFYSHLKCIACVCCLFQCLSHENNAESTWQVRKINIILTAYLAWKSEEFTSFLYLRHWFKIYIWKFYTNFWLKSFPEKPLFIIIYGSFGSTLI